MLIGSLLISLIFGALTAFVASEKGLSVTLWFVIGTFLGPLGILAAWRMGSRVEKHSKKSKPIHPEESLQFQTLVKKLQYEHNAGPHQKNTNGNAAFNPNKMTKKCPQCCGRIKMKAMVCDYCGHSFTLTQVQQQIREAWQQFKQHPLS